MGNGALAKQGKGQRGSGKGKIYVFPLTFTLYPFPKALPSPHLPKLN